MRTRIILCAHGTGSHSGRSAVASLVNSVRTEADEFDVVDAFVDVQQPVLADVLTETDHCRIVVPLMLSHDLATMEVLDAVAVDGDLVRVAEPIGPDWALAEIGAQRLFEAGALPTDSIVMVAPQADGPKTLADLSRAARLLSAVWGGRVHVGVLDGVGTPVDEAIDIAKAYKRRVVVSKYALTSGEASAAMGRLGADVVTAPLLGAGVADPQLVDLVLSRAIGRKRPSELDLASG